MIVAVALDTAGADAVRDFVRPKNMAELEPFIVGFMGWDREIFERAAAPTYPCLIDRDHVTAQLYGFVNVPMAVWIDEDGRIVRPAEPAGVSDTFRAMDPNTLQLPREAVEDGKQRRRIYLAALRDWIEKGEKSVHALPPAEVRRRRKGPNERESRAMAHFRLGAWLHRGGHAQAAATHIAEALRLRPESWSFRRQKIVLSDPALTGQFGADADFLQAVHDLGDDFYYPPVHMEGMPPPFHPLRAKS